MPPKPKSQQESKSPNRKARRPATTTPGRKSKPATPRASRTSATPVSAARSAKRGQQAAAAPASQLIDERIANLGDWRGATLARMRALILGADPGMTEEWKWRGTPVWSHHGIICTGETYKQIVKFTFAHGASLPDPHGLFNASLEGGTRRAIDLREGETIDTRAFKALIKAAVARNASTAGAGRASKSSSGKPGAVVLLSGGNPQIAKADGDAPVQAYIAAMPGWKSDLGKRLDALIVRNVPNVQKAVRWNSPFYGVEGRGWFLSFHVFTRFVKVTFFAGRSLQPLPPGGTPKSQESRWIDIYENRPFDEAQMASWVKQAAALPGWIP